MSEKLKPCELPEIFGEFMPVEALALIQSWEGTADDLRTELRKRSSRTLTPEQRND